MNDINTGFLKTTAMPDVQSSVDHRNIAIDRVGIRGVRHPIQVKTEAGVQPSVAVIDLDVSLPGDKKGTHMSRFIALLQDQKSPIDAQQMRLMTSQMLPLLEAEAGQISLKYTHFINKTAPVSGVQSLLDYDVTWLALAKKVNGEVQVDLRLQAVVPVTSLCPCSKEISEYGAHNQRSHVTMTVELSPTSVLSIEDLVKIAEAEASCELWGLLKRPDEKFVTERAYDNPKFVEDLVRDVAGRLKSDSRIQSFVVEAENFESIHNHSAYALIRSE
ncbi:MAG: GTP cyclohydrolase I FolE2 [Polynucleobacter sp.]|nr:MAG: GTP cyclohydrolase I FolE2 [Polynucleobacter sp.]